jgi:thiamine-phosphate pyrophosphorylase
LNIQGVYGITPDRSELWGEVALLECIEAVLEGGVKLLQLRQKHLPWPQLLAFAQQVGALCQKYEAALLLNDAPVLDLLSVQNEIPNLMGVHLGKDDMPLAHARALLGAKACIGASCYNRLALAEQATQAGASYVAFGAVYPSQTKPEAVPASLALFAQAQLLGVPRVAIGGITLPNVKELVTAGADAIAVVSALFETKNGKPDAQAVRLNAARWVQEFEYWRGRQ